VAAIDPAERLLNLVIALTHARVRMTRSEIRNSVAGYDPVAPAGDAAEAKRRDAAFERMFERDKDDLRRMGLPLRTVTDATHGDDIGYKIDATDAALEPLELTQAELAVLALAAEYWQGATLGADAKLALTKAASSAEPRLAAVLPFAARSTASQDATATLAEAIQERQRVQFVYASAASDTEERTVEPWRILIRGGAEYVFGFDVERGEPRTYRIVRIEGAVRPIGPPGTYDIPDRLPERFFAAQPTHTARVAVLPEAGHALRARGTLVGRDGPWELFDVPYAHEDSLRDEVLGLAGVARVVSPSSVADAVSAYALAGLEVTGG